VYTVAKWRKYAVNKFKIRSLPDDVKDADDVVSVATVVAGCFAVVVDDVTDTSDGDDHDENEHCQRQTLC